VLKIGDRGRFRPFRGLRPDKAEVISTDVDPPGSRKEFLGSFGGDYMAFFSMQAGAWLGPKSAERLDQRDTGGRNGGVQYPWRAFVGERRALRNVTRDS